MHGTRIKTRGFTFLDT